MKRFGKHDIPALGGIFLLTLVIMAVSLSGGTVYGSQDDWASQHYAIPEYFRTLFYSTHELFPSWAPNIGGGENIYSLSYYGLYSPVIMLSYLLPFVPMSYYIMATSIISVFVSEGALYTFFRRRKGTAVTACVTLFFALSVPLIINSHRQIMFTGYMPFLLLSMLSTDSFFSKGRKAPLILFTFLMIMCNYYFAVSAVISLACYGFFIILSGGKIKPLDMIRRYLPFAASLAVSVMMSGILLLPTAYVLASGRSGDNVLSLRDFLPTIRFDRLTYFGYTMGLSAFGVFSAIFALFRGKRGTRFIAALVLLTAVFPAVIYLLNGTLYIDPKVLFAFLPLALIPVSELLEHCFSMKKGSFSEYFSSGAFITFVICSVISVICCKASIFILTFIADAVLFAIGSVIIAKSSKKQFCCIFFAVPLLTCVFGNRYDKLQTLESFNNVNSSSVAKLVSEASEGRMVRTAIDTTRLFTVNKVYAPNHYQDTLYSSVHSQDYNSFYLSEMFNENEYRNSALTTRSRNILFNSRMGNRYYITHEEVDFFGLKLIDMTSDGYYLYENKYAFPLIWTGSEKMSLRQYKSLGYPYNTEALMKYVIVPEDLPDTDFTPSILQTDIGDIFDISECENVSGEYDSDLTDGVWHIHPEGGSMSYTYKLPADTHDKIILLRFRVDNNQKNSFSWERGGDVRIRINGVKNTLTNPEWKYHNNNYLFEYVISDLSDSLRIELTGKEIAVSELSAYTLEPQFLSSLTDHLSVFQPDISMTGGDRIRGILSAENDGIADTSFVYHDGFNITIDGRKVTPVKTDTAFLGFPIEEGEHELEILFTAPLLGLGKLVSLSGIILFAAELLIEIKKRISCKK